MKNKQKITYLIILLFVSSIVTAQDTYIAKHDSLSYGVNIIGGTDFVNSLICRVKQKDNTIEYSPEQITEYGTEDGRVYISKELSINGYTKKYFLERLVKGNVNLYYLKQKRGKLFFIEKDTSIFKLITKKDTNLNTSFKDVLKQYCKDTSAVKLSKYKKKNLSLLIERHNLGIIKPFPFNKYGLFVGLSATNIISPENINSKYAYNINSKYDYNFTIGAFIDLSLSLSNASFHTEVYFTQNAFSETIKINNTVNDVLLKYSSISIPILIRYTYTSNKIKPFVNLGLLSSYHFNIEQEIFKSQYDENIVYLEKITVNSILSEKQIGYALGMGAQYNLNYKKALYSEIRYSKQYGIPKFDTLKKSIFHLIIGINF